MDEKKILDLSTCSDAEFEAIKSGLDSFVKNTGKPRYFGYVDKADLKNLAKEFGYFDKRAGLTGIVLGVAGTFAGAKVVKVIKNKLQKKKEEQ